MRLKLLIVCSVLAAGASSLMGQSPNGRTGTLVVLNKSVATATFIDVASGETLATLPTGRGPHEFADGRWAVSTDYSGGNSLTVFDVQNLSVERTIDLGSYPRPHGAFFLPRDSIMAITSEASQNVALVNPFRGEIVSVIATGAGGSHMVAVTGDGATLYTGNMQAATVSELDVATARRTRTFAVPGTPRRSRSAGMARRFGSAQTPRGSSRSLKPKAVTSARDSPGSSGPTASSSSRIVTSSSYPTWARHVVRFVDYGDRTDIGTLPFPGEGPQGVALTPDHGTVFLSLSSSGEIAVIDLTTRRVVRRIDSGPSPDGIGWSPLVLRR